MHMFIRSIPEMRNVRQILAAAALSAVGTVSAAGTAMGAESEGDLDEVVVSAQRTGNQTLQETPISISVLSGSDLQMNGVSQFSDYVNLVPGLSDIGYGTPGHTVTILRGLTTGSQQSASTVGYYLDETPFVQSSAVGYGGLLTPDPDLGDIERLEVLKGPQSTLYGASALGGVIRAVSKQADLKSWDFSARADGLSVQDGGTGFAVRGVVNIPVIDDKVAVRVSAFDRRDPGFIRNTTLNSTNTNVADVSGGRVVLRVVPAENVDLELSTLLQNIRSYGFANEYVDRLSLQPIAGDLTNFAAFNPSLDTKYRVSNLTATIHTGWGTLINSSSYATVRDDENYDYTPYFTPFSQQAGITPAAGLGSPVALRAEHAEIIGGAALCFEAIWRGRVSGGWILHPRRYLLPARHG